MPGTYDTSDRYALRALTGSSAIEDIDEGFAFLRDDVSALLAPFYQGSLASRPVSTPVSPGIAGRVYRATDGANAGRVFRDYGTGWEEGVTTAEADAAAGVASRRTLGTSSTSAVAGNDARIPTQAENDALVGTSGTPSGSNPYATKDSLARGLVSAYFATTASVAVTAIIVLNAEEFDVSGWFNTANGLYTPTVAGYYDIAWMVNGISTADSLFQSALYKSGVEYKRSAAEWTGSGAGVGAGGSAKVHANGTTDTFGIGVVQSTPTPTVLGGASQTYFTAALIAAD